MQPQPILEGNRLALSRLLTQVENDSLEGRNALAELFPHTGRAHLIGVKGAPGTGKSSLVNQLTLHYRTDRKKKVAIIAVDPSSPFTGGAVMGDRVRMRDLSGDDGLFIRSMASRGSVAGLAQKTASVAYKGVLARALRERVWPLVRSRPHQASDPQGVSRAADAAGAHALMESSTHVGKIVLQW